MNAPLLRLAQGYRFQWEPAQNRFVLLYPEGMVTLNDSAAEILKRCNGTLDEAGVVADLHAAYPAAELTELQNDVREFLEVAFERGWLDR